MKVGKACGIDGIPNECHRHLQEDHCTFDTFTSAFNILIFQVFGRFAEVITILKPSKDPKFPQNLCLISLLSAMGKLFEKGIL
jgi:hypothetical protein